MENHRSVGLHRNPTMTGCSASQYQYEAVAAAMGGRADRTPGRPKRWWLCVYGVEDGKGFGEERAGYIYIGYSRPPLPEVGWFLRSASAFSLPVSVKPHFFLFQFRKLVFLFCFYPRFLTFISSLLL